MSYVDWDKYPIGRMQHRTYFLVHVFGCFKSNANVVDAAGFHVSFFEQWIYDVVEVGCAEAIMAIASAYLTRLVVFFVTVMRLVLVLVNSRRGDRL